MRVQMKPRITVLTIGVDDLQAALTFYRDGLGFPTEGIIGEEFADGAVVFFELENGMKLALCPRKSLAQDAAISPTPTSPTEFSIGHNVASKEDVDAVMERAQEIGR